MNRKMIIIIILVIITILNIILFKNYYKAKIEDNKNKVVNIVEDRR